MESSLYYKLRELPPQHLIELLLYVIDPSSTEIVESFTELIEDNADAIEEELSENEQEGTAD